MRLKVGFYESSAPRDGMAWLLFVAPVFILGLNFVGLRPETAGNDTVRYLYTYQQLGSPVTAVTDGVRTFGNTELLWWPLQSLFKPIVDGQGWLVLNYLIVFCSVYVFYRFCCRSYRLNPSIFAFVFMTFFLVYSGNIMRQAMAVPIGALGFYFFFQRKYILWVVLSLVALGIHWSSLVVLAAPVFMLRVFARDWTYLAVPVFALAASVFAKSIIGGVVAIVGFSGFERKYDLYFSSAHESHVGQVWGTANFWLCVSLSILFLAICPASRYSNRSLHAFVVLHLSLVLLGVRVPDFSERYLPALLLSLPLIVILMVRRTNLTPLIKNSVVLGSFFTLGVLVFITPSARFTLGYFI